MYTYNICQFNKPAAIPVIYVKENWDNWQPITINHLINAPGSY